MTDPEDKFSEKHTGKAFSVFDEEIIAYSVEKPSSTRC